MNRLSLARRTQIIGALVEGNSIRSSLMQMTVCNYCGRHSEAHECLSDTQRFCVEACCLLFRTALENK